MNTTKAANIQALVDHDFDQADIKILSMDGRDDTDNIFIERLWRSLKQEAASSHEITDGFKQNGSLTGLSSTTQSALHTAL
jgi:hypothetical protein